MNYGNGFFYLAEIGYFRLAQNGCFRPALTFVMYLCKNVHLKEDCNTQKRGSCYD